MKFKFSLSLGLIILLITSVSQCRSKNQIQSKVNFILNENIQKISNWETAKLTTLAIVNISETKSISTLAGNMPIGKLEIAYQASGIVYAGFDLEDEVNIYKIGNITYIDLPAPRILSVELDHDESELIMENHVFISPSEGDLVLKAQEMGMQKLRDIACDKQLLDTASDQAETLIKQWMDSKVVVTIPDNGDCM